MQDTYEVWTEKVSGEWSRIVEKDNGGIFENEKRALAIGGKAAQDEEVVRVVIIKRIPVTEFNGAAKTIRFVKIKKPMIGNVPKKEEAHEHGIDVHGGRPPEGPVEGGGVQHAGGEDRGEADRK